MTSRTHRRLLVGAAFAALAALTAPAGAADINDGGSFKDAPAFPEMFPPIWAGFYFGAHAGFGWGSFKPTDVDPNSRRADRREYRA